MNQTQHSREKSYVKTWTRSHSQNEPLSSQNQCLINFRRRWKKTRFKLLKWLKECVTFPKIWKFHQASQPVQTISTLLQPYLRWVLELLLHVLEAWINFFLQLKDELKVLEGKRLEHLPMFIKNCGDELNLIWNQCYVDDSTKSAFYVTLDSKDGDEEILSHYEETIKLWKKYHSTNKLLLDKVRFVNFFRSVHSC